MAGRLDRARTSRFGFESDGVDVMVAEADDAAFGESNDRSSMKFPAARLLAVRGRWRIREMSYA